MHRRGLVRFNLTVTVPADIDGLSLEALKALVVQLLSKAADQDRLIAELREENARLKGMNGRPRIRPSGMADASEPKLPGTGGKHRRRGKITPRVGDRGSGDRKAQVLPGSRFKGYETFVVQDIVLHAEAIRVTGGSAGLRRMERWVLGLASRRERAFRAGTASFLCCRNTIGGQVTVQRLVAQLRGIGVAISKRQLMRLLIGWTGRLPRREP